MSQEAQILLGFAGTALAAYLTYLGVKFTANRAKEGVQQTSKVDAQQSALAAWEKLLEPYRQEVDRLRAEIGSMRETHRLEHERREEQVTRLSERIDLLNLQLSEWKRVARVIAKWATSLRDEVLHLGGTVPATPEELLTMQALDEREET